MAGLTLRGVGFKSVFTASGTLNFFGDGWPPHRLFSSFFGKRFDFSGATFISKTTTLSPRAGHMPLDNDLQPREYFPKCINANYWKGVTLNSVGLSGPGAIELFRRKKWQSRIWPFLISFMSVGSSPDLRLGEAAKFADMLIAEQPNFQTDFGIQVNVSCPNTDHATREMIDGSLGILEVFKKLSVPIDLKIGVADAIEAGTPFTREIEASGLCDCLTCSNTIPWGRLPERIDWPALFGTRESPLKHLGGGGLSGKPLKPIVIEWLKTVRDAGITMPIKAGGGILARRDVREYMEAGASAFEIGSIAILRPWNVRRVIETGNNIFRR